MKNGEFCLKSGVLRTPDEQFSGLHDYNFKPHYLMVQDLRLHYVDEGPADASPILLLHGEPSWSYLYRKIIPILAQDGYRVIAPDLVGFGRSDKLPTQQAYSYQMHVGQMTEFVTQLNLSDLTLFAQDWGGLIGLRVVAREPDRFERIIAGNTGLPDAGVVLGHIAPILFRLKVWIEGRVSLDELRKKPTLIRWVAYSRTTREFPVGTIVQMSTISDMSPEVMAAYDAPFPDDRYKAAVRVMPSLIPSQLYQNRQVWEQVLGKWQKPFLTAFSDSDPITRGGERAFQKRIPGAQGQPHVTIKDAGHFLQEDKGEELASVILEFIAYSRSH
jgi:haloalkane dehalogenase